MDFWSIVVIASVSISGLVMIIGPLAELKGKIFFVEAKCAPKTSGRWGMRVMVLSMVLFVGGLLLRSVLPSGVVTPFVLLGFVLWFVGGVVALVRNEVIKALDENSDSSVNQKEQMGREQSGSAYLHS